ncbi:uncharacterized protein PgNI_07349 [Pyricularia grisea]|uniref:Uncharacterized protein n=1 Tax=Pyricularia grisea TaxID=148305 RepID=A0A6P8B2V2_PYRGI|nr:uncharacterized protein PgNI_07349 [Pyricularia grisea]TLD09196.1 hypothetical protein PgNI_07349 [Pyricularia grisea]
MHTSSFFSLVVSITGVLGDNITFGTGSTGGRCCDHGVSDPSETCKKKGLNSYGCTDWSYSAKDGGDFLYFPKGGCDVDTVKNWPVGRDVLDFIPGSVVTHLKEKTSDLEVGFIGCAN